MKFILLYDGGLKEFEVGSSCTLGRREGDLIISDELMSGKHATFHVEDEKLFLTDLGSSNGTSINKKKIEKNKAVEVSDRDDIRMGAQTIKVKIIKETFDPVGTHIEAEGTHIEESLPGPADGTFVEGLSPNALSSSKQKVEKAPPPLVQHTSSSPTRSLTGAENKEISILTEAPPPKKKIMIPASLLAEENPEKTKKELFDEMAQKLVQRFGAQKIIIAASVIIGIFTFLVFAKKTTPPRQIAVATHETPAKVAAAPTPPPVENKVPNSTPPSAAENPTSIAAVEPPSPPAEEVAPVEAVAEVPQIEVKPQVKKTAKKKIVAKTDAKSETSFLTQLAVMRKDYQKAKSFRVRAALEIDAAELCNTHYAKLKKVIVDRWNKSRGLASLERQKLKKTLQGQLVTLNNKAKSVRAKIPAYLAGKLKSPF